jgi:AcrR family transcriptional regulator
MIGCGAGVPAERAFDFCRPGRRVTSVAYHSGVTVDSRQSGAETRRQVIEAAAVLLEERGAAVLNVSAIMERAGISRTAFYRQFDDVHGVVATLLDAISGELAENAGAWFNEENAIGSRAVIYGNALRSGRTIQPRIGLIAAVVDATALDASLRRLWRETVLQPRIDAAAHAIRRDQTAGEVPAGIDPDATALALTLMGEQVALEVLGRRGGSPEEYATILAPIWEAVLFGHAGHD